ncbi:hypothetical protein ACSRUE_04545 [Sorangium sp. KYC3313]|uniref:hypothetical protein n=1 Tax=Sorangium sp. KYC3313 TaxID=3449740 RepID=UPI003F8CD965
MKKMTDDPFTLVVINGEGDGYYVIDSRDLGPPKRPLEPICKELVEQRVATQHVPYADAPPAHLLVEQELARGAAAEHVGPAEFCGTFYFNLNAFKPQD